MRTFEFKIHGPIKGGKNNMLMTRRGQHYPNPKWAAWRDGVVKGIMDLLPNPWEPFYKPLSMAVVYIPADLKRRDLPAMIDSIFHCLEKAGVVTDDCLIKSIRWESLPKDKVNAGASIFMEER